MSTASSPSGFDESFPKEDLVLPEDLREELAKPIGRFVSAWALRKHLEGATRVITVGDVVTVTLLQMGMVPDVAVFDYKTQRSEEYSSKARIAKMEGRLVKVENPPAMITREMWRAVKEAVQADDVVKVEVSGEEDLAALVAIINAPEGAQVIYGIPNKGLTVVSVDKDTRALASAAVRRMVR
ncbi:MAG: GTP-dependent dephospho-CoA kinase [Candidatus Thermoplasmatota archaeon]|nr:GTP-dependent dephospho-CoA kinase [Candidatus Thermoplasmatota archaeon]